MLATCAAKLSICDLLLLSWPVLYTTPPITAVVLAVRSDHSKHTKYVAYLPHFRSVIEVNLQIVFQPPQNRVSSRIVALVSQRGAPLKEGFDFSLVDLSGITGLPRIGKRHPAVLPAQQARTRLLHQSVHAADGARIRTPLVCTLLKVLVESGRFFSLELASPTA